MKRTLLFAAYITLVAGLCVAAALQPAGTSHNGAAFRFNKVAEGVYHVIGTGAMETVGNGAVIVNDDDVVLVDDYVSPAAAWVLLEELKTLTDKPVRTVINTHYHFDHAHGNQIFGKEVQIIGHEATREMLLGGKSAAMPLYKGYVARLPTQIQTLRQRLAAETDATRKKELQAQLQAAENNAASQAEFKSTPPNVTLNSQLTLYRGSREIQIRFLGRAHTNGDVVVYLPKEKIVITGDMLTAALSNMSDSYPLEWADTLEALKKLDFTTVLPGHGEAFTDRKKIDNFQAYLRDAWSEVGKLKQQGVSAQDAAARADMTKHREHFPNITGPGVSLLGVNRMYELMDAQR